MDHLRLSVTTRLDLRSGVFYKGRHMHPGQLWQMRSTGSKRDAEWGEEGRRGDERGKAGHQVCAGSSLLVHLSTIDCMPAVSQLKASPEISLSIPHFTDQEMEPLEDKYLTRGHSADWLSHSFCAVRVCSLAPRRVSDAK